MAPSLPSPAKWKPSSVANTSKRVTLRQPIKSCKWHGDLSLRGAGRKVPAGTVRPLPKHCKSRVSHGAGQGTRRRWVTGDQGQEAGVRRSLVPAPSKLAAAESGLTQDGLPEPTWSEPPPEGRCVNVGRSPHPCPQLPAADSPRTLLPASWHPAPPLGHPGCPR